MGNARRKSVIKMSNSDLRNFFSVCSTLLRVSVQKHAQIFSLLQCLMCLLLQRNNCFPLKFQVSKYKTTFRLIIMYILSTNVRYIFLNLKNFEGKNTFLIQISKKKKKKDQFNHRKNIF